jgi:hypothetical protein
MIYLGTIDNAGSDVKNNANTSSAFVIPPGTVALRLQPNAATMMAVLKYADDSAFAPAATAMLQLGAANSFNDLPIWRSADLIAIAPRVGLLLTPLTLAVRKTDAGAGTTKVFAIAIP